MGTLCQCLVRFCCDTSDEQERRRLQILEEPDRMMMQRGADDACPPSIHDFWRRLRDRWQSPEQFYDIMRQQSPSEEEDDDDDETSCSIRKVVHMSPHQATSFSSNRDIPCIHLDEIVFPGSAIQRKMAEQLASAKLKDDDIECVICMEQFDAENPRMPTICGCGENKTFFHLPCLYQWIEQNENCPSCRSKLSWEEF